MRHRAGIRLLRWPGFAAPCWGSTILRRRPVVPGAIDDEVELNSSAGRRDRPLLAQVLRFSARRTTHSDHAHTCHQCVTLR
jgi:hypothetical protein